MKKRMLLLSCLLLGLVGLGLALGLTAFQKNPTGPITPAPSLEDLVEQLGHESVIDRRDAAQALGELGPGARAALPGLRAALRDKDPHTRMMAVIALWRIDREAEPLLLELSARWPRCNLAGPGNPPDPFDDFHRGCQELLFATREGFTASGGSAGAGGNSKADVKDAILAIVKALGSKDAGVRETAVMVLGVGPAETRADLVAPAFIRALQDENLRVRIYAIAFLIKLGPAARPAVPVLQGILDRDCPCAACTIIALWGTQPPSWAQIPQAIFMIDLEEPLRRSAADTLKQIDPQAAAKAGVR